MYMASFQNNTNSTYNFLAIDFDNNTISGSIGSPAMDEELAKEFLSKKYKKFKILSDQEFDALDQEFINAYDIGKSNLRINISKAKEIKKENLRNERIQKLKELDLLFMIALENGESTSDIVSEKNRLRDITKLVDSAITLEDIKAIQI